MDFPLLPCMTSVTTDLARDLLLPGFPTMKRGILSSIMMAIIQTFSYKNIIEPVLSIEINIIVP